jgi:hypothetical protein
MSVNFRTWHQVHKRVVGRIEGDKLRHARYYKIKGEATREDVVKGAVAHLLKPESVLPYSLRRRLKTRRHGNVTLRNVDPDAWGVWLRFYERHILGGSFWYEDDPAIDNLIDLAVDGSRAEVCSATADTGGPKDGKLDHRISELVSRLTGASQTFRDGAQREALSSARLGAEQSALEELEQTEREENEKFRRAINAAPWARKLLKKPEKLDALNMILFEPELLGRDIAASCGLAESTVSKLRAKVEELADKILLIPEERDRAVPDEEVREFYDTHKGQIAQPYEAVAENIREYLSHRPSTADTAPDVTLDAPLDAPPDAVFDDELEPLGAAEVDRQGDTAPLDVAALTLSPVQGDADGDCSESALRGHARTRAAERAQRGGPGRQPITDAAMDRGYENHKYKDKDQERKHRVCALRVRGVKQEKSRKRYVGIAARHLQRKAREAGFDIDGARRLIDEYVEQRLRELDIAAEKHVAIFKALFETAVLQDVEALSWVAPWCTERRYSPNDLFGTTNLRTTPDDMLGATITGPKSSDQFSTHEESDDE